MLQHIVNSQGRGCSSGGKAPVCQFCHWLISTVAYLVPSEKLFPPPHSLPCIATGLLKELLASAIKKAVSPVHVIIKAKKIGLIISLQNRVRTDWWKAIQYTDLEIPATDAVCYKDFKNITNHAVKNKVDVHGLVERGKGSGEKRYNDACKHLSIM